MQLKTMVLPAWSHCATGNSFDGQRVQFGDGRVEARDRVAGLFGRYQHPFHLADPLRMAKRVTKYVQRGITFDDYINLSSFLGRWVIEHGML